jgi:hypothetical protein
MVIYYKSVIFLFLVFFCKNIIAQNNPKVIEKKLPIEMYTNPHGLNGHQTLYNEESWFAGKNQDEVIGFWTKQLDVDYDSLKIETPISLYVLDYIYEDYPFGENNYHSYKFEDFKKACFETFIHHSLRYDERDWGVFSVDNYHANSFGQMICKKSLSIRKMAIEFAIGCYENLESQIPITWKRHFIARLGELISFAEKFKINRGVYLKYIENNKSYYDRKAYSSGEEYVDFINYVGYYEAFIFRRIEYDKIPSNEIVNYLKLIQAAMKKSIMKDSYTNYFTLYINKGDLIISDKMIDWQGLQVSIYNSYSNKELVINRFYGVKCIELKSKTYYQIFSEEYSFKEGKYIDKTILIDDKLNLIPA